MPLTLDPGQLERFPIHDAELLGFSSFQEASSGDLCAALDMRITDRSYDPGYRCPEADGATRLVFRDCRLIRTDLKGGSSDRDSLVELEVLDSSDLLSEAAAWPSPLPAGTRHYRITTGAGSTLDIVSAEVVAAAPSA